MLPGRFALLSSGRCNLHYLFEVILVGVEASEQGNLHDGHCGLSITLESGDFTAPVSSSCLSPHAPTAIIFCLEECSSLPLRLPITPLPPTAYSFNKQESDMSPPCLTPFIKCLSPFHFTSSHPSLHLIALKCQSLSCHWTFAHAVPSAWNPHSSLFARKHPFIFAISADASLPLVSLFWSDHSLICPPVAPFPHLTTVVTLH